MFDAQVERFKRDHWFPFKHRERLPIAVQEDWYEQKGIFEVVDLERITRIFSNHSKCGIKKLEE